MASLTRCAALSTLFHQKKRVTVVVILFLDYPLYSQAFALRWSGAEVRRGSGLSDVVLEFPDSHDQQLCFSSTAELPFWLRLSKADVMRAALSKSADGLAWLSPEERRLARVMEARELWYALTNTCCPQ